jgi:hypothetical protein
MLLPRCVNGIPFFATAKTNATIMKIAAPIRIPGFAMAMESVLYI